MVHILNHFRCGPFLGAVDGAATLGAAQNIGDIAGHPELTLGQLGENPVAGDAGQMGKPLGTVRDGAALRVEKAVAQGLEHAHTAVVGGAASDAYQKTAAALGDGVSDDLPHTVGGGVQGIALGLRHQGETRSPGHLHHRGA